MVSHNMKTKFITNDSKIRTASRQLHQGRLSIKSFFLRCSFTVARYEERMRFMALGQNNIESLLINDGKSILIKAISLKIKMLLIVFSYYYVFFFNFKDNLDITVDDPSKC